MNYPRYFYAADGFALLVESEDMAAGLSEDWRDSPADFGIETCPGEFPDEAILAKRVNVVMPQEGVALENMTREQLLELAANRTIAVDKRWGVDRLREALA